MNHSLGRRSRQLLITMLSYVVVLAQITMLLGTTVAAIQPTPQMVQTLIQQAGGVGASWSWLAQSAAGLMQFAQPILGSPSVAYAQSSNPPVVSANPAVVTFPSTPAGSTSITQTVIIANIANPASVISAGGYTTCAVTNAGGVKCWGRNSYGQVGDGTNQGHTAPVDVLGLTSGVLAVQNGWDHACALTTSGGVKCWGGNSNGQLGDNSYTTRNTPVDVYGLSSGVIAIAAGEYHTCALTNTGSV